MSISHLPDNIRSLPIAETLPIMEYFRTKGRCEKIDTSQDRQTVYKIVKDRLASHTTASFAERLLSNRAEMLLGISPC